MSFTTDPLAANAAKSDVNALTYDESAALGENTAAIDAVVNAFIGELEAIRAARQAAIDAAAAKAVDEKILAIGEVEYTDACKAKIDDASASYEALTDTQRSLVEKLEILEAAKARYNELKAQAEQQESPTEGQTDPAAPSGPSDGGNKCKWCGKTHTGFRGAIVRFFHSVAYFFAHLFGRR